MNELQLQKSYWASVSGGKDSLYMLRYILQHPERYPLNGVVHFELEIDYPFIKDVIDYMESECTSRGIPFYRIRPTTTWNELYDKNGFPTRKARWCNGQYKMDALKQLKSLLLSQKKELYSYIGYCYDEVSRYSKRKAANEIYPLVEGEILESDILKWAAEQPIFNDYYKYMKRCGCMYCPMISRLEMAYQLKYYPDHYSDMMSKARATEKKVAAQLGREQFSVWDGHAKYDTDYIDNIVRKKWLPKLEEMEMHYENNLED